ncbi:hypothetical protein GCM10012275_22380 [Longimycelium tulufanense]|uniref:Transport permease protein n=1 Tax=Longimycelium tulufanense TaxID=907463 RepID=A0A8J3CDQ9_9PSEU|nr:ABC transporter permease [Longimycelium tulufanense]GGM51021.1 hypothetical protein GCM10012275_22380 [Longimycelium tulufanense]
MSAPRRDRRRDGPPEYVWVPSPLVHAASDQPTVRMRHPAASSTSNGVVPDGVRSLEPPEAPPPSTTDLSSRIQQRTPPPEAEEQPDNGAWINSFRSLSAAMAKGFARDKVGVFFTFLFPLMFLVVFGLLFRDDSATKTRIAVVGDGPVVAALQRAGAVDLERMGSATEAVAKVQRGDVPAALVVNGNAVQLRFAASNQTEATTVQGLVGGVVDKVNLASSGRPPAVKLDSRQVEDSSLKAIQFITPGTLSLAVSSSAILGATLTLVSWRRKQVLRRLRLAPVSVATVLTSRLLLSIGIAVVQAALFIGVASAPVFGLRLSGQWYLALPMLVVGTLAFFSIGMLIGSFAKTEESAGALANLLVLTMGFLSGTFFPIEKAPEWLQTVSKLLPLRYLVDGLLGVMVRGQGVEALTVPVVALLLFAIVVALIASQLFVWDDA